MPQLIGLSESYIIIYERKTSWFLRTGKRYSTHKKVPHTQKRYSFREGHLPSSDSARKHLSRSSLLLAESRTKISWFIRIDIHSLLVRKKSSFEHTQIWRTVLIYCFMPRINVANQGGKPTPDTLGTSRGKGALECIHLLGKVWLLECAWSKTQVPHVVSG